MMSKTIYLCKMCGNPHGKRWNALYCDKCLEKIKQKSAFHYKIMINEKDYIDVYVKNNRIKKAVLNDKTLNIFLVNKEIVD